MASLNSEVKYADAVYGNLAYEYGSTAERYATPDEVVAEPERGEKVRKKVRIRVKAKEKVSTSFGVPALGIIGSIVVAAVAVLVLLSYVELTELSANRSDLESQLSSLNEQNAKLTIQYESTFNLSDIEDYAINVLGMSRLTDGDTTIITMDKYDHAEILNEDDSSSGFWDFVTDTVDTILEFFS